MEMPCWLQLKVTCSHAAKPPVDKLSGNRRLEIDTASRLFHVLDLHNHFRGGCNSFSPCIDCPLMPFGRDNLDVRWALYGGSTMSVSSRDILLSLDAQILRCRSVAHPHLFFAKTIETTAQQTAVQSLFE